jgi:hypothetical protein
MIGKSWNCRASRDACGDRSAVCFGLSGQVVQKSIQRAVPSLLGRPMGAIAIAGNLDAHGLPSALNFPAKGICTIAAAAYDDKISSASIVGMHT